MLQTKSWIWAVMFGAAAILAFANMGDLQGWRFVAFVITFASGFLLVFLMTDGSQWQRRTATADILPELTAENDAAPRTPPKPSSSADNVVENIKIAKAIRDSYEDFPIAILQISADNRVEQCNKVAREFLGLKDKENPFFDDLVYGLGRSVPAWIESTPASKFHSNPEVLQTKRDTANAVLQVSLINTPHTPTGTLTATLTDATQLKSLEAQFVQSQKMQAIGQLAGGVAHDFNNLLTAISGYCDLLLLRHEQGDPDYGDLIQIHQNANRAAALVGQLLAFSRKQTLQPQVLRVNETLSDLTHLLNRLLGEKVRLHTEYGKDLPNVFVDGRQLEQVIMNLVVNARDAMPEGGEVIITSAFEVFEDTTVIEKATVIPGDYVRIRVKDTGCGISPDRIQKIFEPFYSTKDVGEGTGLGLSMVYGIIKQTGGFIFVDSTLHKGTIFSILLPAHDGPLDAEPLAQKPKPKTMAALNGLAVMLVEDEAPVRAFASRALGMHGVEVTEAASAEAALAILADDSHVVDVIVSDVVMPGMNGPTWVRMALEKRPDTKVIFVSGYAEESFEKEHSEISNAVFLQKPFSLQQLIGKVRELSQ